MHDLTLEQLRLNELSDEDARQARELIAADPSAAARLRTIESSDTAMADDGALQAMTVGVLARVQQDGRQRKRRKLLLSSAMPATAVILLALLLYPQFRPRITGGGDGVRQKGDESTLAVYRDTSAGSERLSDNDLAREGDVIRLGYRTNQQYGAILSVDRRHVVTRHLPIEGSSAPKLETSALVLLEKAYELDDAPLVERFYLITSSAPFAIEPVAAALAAAGADSRPVLSPPLHVVTFSLRKESRP